MKLDNKPKKTKTGKVVNNDRQIRWEKTTLVFIAAVAAITAAMLVLFLLGKTVWDFPMFILFDAILLFLALIYYMIIRSKELKRYKKGLLFGLIALNFILLFLICGMAVILAIKAYDAV